jgi:hypothetical protein
VTVPDVVRQINSLSVIGEGVNFDTATGVLQVNSASDDAVLVRNDGAQRSILGLGGRGSLSVPNGGITVLGTTAIASSRNQLTGGTMSADRLLLLGGVAGPNQITVAHDVQVGHPGATRSTLPVASFHASRSGFHATVGGAVRIHPDGSMSGFVTAAGGVNNAGTIDAGTSIVGDLLTSGEFNAGDDRASASWVSSVEGDFVQTAEGVLRIVSTKNLATKPLTLSDGAIDLAGTIVFTPSTRGEFPQLNDRYPLIGAEAPINYTATLTSGLAGYRFDPLLVPGEGLYAIVTAVPEPAAGGLAMLLAFPALRRRRR